MLEPKVAGFRDLKVWAKGMEIAAGVYALSKQMPRSE